MEYISEYNSLKRTLYVMCGLQCSGKSTFSKNMQKEALNEIKIVSSDQIRLDYPEIAQDNEKVFEKYYADINYWIRQGFDVIADATNISIKSRKQIFNRVKEPCNKICYVFNVPIGECIHRLDARNSSEYPNKIPLEALCRYQRSFEIPFKEEGWDNIYLVNDKDINKYSLASQLLIMKNFDQDTAYHTDTLGEHSLKTYNKLKEEIDFFDDNLKESINLIRGAYLHDVGKLFCGHYKEGDSNQHFYNHENVGAYWKICNGWTLEEAFYENYHMRPNNWKSEKALKKAVELFGQIKVDNLLLLNQCDKFR